MANRVCMVGEGRISFIETSLLFYFTLNTTSSLLEPMRKGGPQRERPCDT